MPYSDVDVLQITQNHINQFNLNQAYKLKRPFLLANYAIFDLSRHSPHLTMPHAFSFSLNPKYFFFILNCNYDLASLPH